MTSTKRDTLTSQERIRHEATVLFYEKGYHATTMREIAAQVGMKAGSLYNHYPSKQNILFEIASETMLELLRAARDAVASESTPEARLRKLVQRHVEYHAARRLQAKVADDQLNGLEPENRAKAIQIRDEYEALVKSVIQDGRDTAGWAVADVSIVTFAVLTMATGVGTWYRENGPATPQQIADIYAGLILRAVGCDPKSDDPSKLAEGPASTLARASDL
jgi:AcrR family transcriptional regulator